MKYTNVPPKHKNARMGSSAIHLDGVDMIDFKSQIEYKNIFFMICDR